MRHYIISFTPHNWTSSGISEWENVFGYPSFYALLHVIGPESGTEPADSKTEPRNDFRMFTAHFLTIQDKDSVLKYQHEVLSNLDRTRRNSNYAVCPDKRISRQLMETWTSVKQVQPNLIISERTTTLCFFPIIDNLFLFTLIYAFILLSTMLKLKRPWLMHLLLSCLTSSYSNTWSCGKKKLIEARLLAESKLNIVLYFL